MCANTLYTDRYWKYVVGAVNDAKWPLHVDLSEVIIKQVIWRWDYCARYSTKWNRSYSPLNVPRNEIKSVDNLYVKRCDKKCLFRWAACRLWNGKKFATNRYQSISIKLSIAIGNRWQSIKSHKDLLHRLVIDYQYQSINWYRLILIDIDCHRLETPGFHSSWAS